MRTLSALIAGLVIYAVAVTSGLASARPLFFVVVGLFLMSVLTFFYNLVRAVPLWRQVKPLFSHWTEHPEPEHVKVRAVYAALTMSGGISAMLGIVFGAALAGGY